MAKGEAPHAGGERGEVWRRWRGGESSLSDFFCASLVGGESRIALARLADGVGSGDGRHSLDRLHTTIN